MIQNLDIVDAVKAAGVENDDPARERIIWIVKKILETAGIYETKKGRVRQGHLSKYGNKICLLFEETDGIKLLPVFPGMEIEILIDGEWQRFVIERDKSGKAKIPVSDEIAIFGEFARIGLSLDGSGFPSLKMKNLQITEGKENV